MNDNMIALYGAGNLGRYIGGLLAKPFVFVDDTAEKQGSKVDGAPVLSWERLAKEHPSASVYSCIFLDISAYDYSCRRTAVQKKYGIDLKPFQPLLVELNGKFHFFEPRQQLQKKMPLYENLKKTLADAHSVAVLDGHLALRTSGNPSELVVTKSWNDLDFLWSRLPPNINYVDVGAFDGDTICDFIGAVKAFGNIWAVEADAGNLQRLRKRMKEGELAKVAERICILNAAVARQRGNLRFQSRGEMNSALAEQGDDVVLAVLLEDIDVPPPAFYKLDIEGEDLAVVRQALPFIKRTRPFLSLSAYHEPDDLLEMYAAIAELDVDYRFYLRCMAENGFDLMLFCIPQ